MIYSCPARATLPHEVADVPTESESSSIGTGHDEYDDGVLRMTPVGNPSGLAIAGEIDEDTYPALVAKLEEFAGGDEIHLNLAGVEYCDLAGLRAIIRLAGVGHVRDSRRVVLHEIPPQLRTVLSILGWDSTPGLLIEDATLGPR
jgi:ABC-type transporter Mla MlaB component